MSLKFNYILIDVVQLTTLIKWVYTSRLFFWISPDWYISFLFTDRVLMCVLSQVFPVSSPRQSTPTTILSEQPMKQPKSRLMNVNSDYETYPLSLSCCSHFGAQSIRQTLVSLQFLNLKIVGRTPCTGDEPVEKPLPKQTQNKRRHPCLSWIRTYDPNVRAGEDRAAIVIGYERNQRMINYKPSDGFIVDGALFNHALWTINIFLINYNDKGPISAHASQQNLF
jgi:hypothetical protein